MRAAAVLPGASSRRAAAESTWPPNTRTWQSAATLQGVRSRTTSRRLPRARARRACCELSAVDVHAGMTTDEFNQIVRDWMASARHPDDSGRPYDQMHLPADGRGPPLPAQPADSRRSSCRAAASSSCAAGWSRRYGIPNEQVVGSRGQTEVRRPGRDAGPAQSARNRISSTMDRGSPSASLR